MDVWLLVLLLDTYRQYQRLKMSGTKSEKTSDPQIGESTEEDAVRIICYHSPIIINVYLVE